MDDDCWYDDDAPEEAELERENRVRQERFSKSGFREGVTEGSPVQHQAGSHAGYRSGLAKAKAAGAAEAAHAQLRTAASPAHCIGDSSLLPNMNGSGNEIVKVSTVGPGMDAIPEIETESAPTQDAAQHLHIAQVTVREFKYGKFPSGISF